MVIGKMGSGEPSVAYDEAVEEALCFGWIDAMPNKVDEQRYKVVFAPRKPTSSWSSLNKGRAQAMIAAGRMTAAGQAKIDEAKRNGAWQRLEEVEALVVPPDLALAFAQEPEARARYDAFSRSAKRGLLEWIQAAKRDQTRARRIAQTVACAGRGEVANAFRASSVD